MNRNPFNLGSTESKIAVMKSYVEGAPIIALSMQDQLPPELLIREESEATRKEPSWNWDRFTYIPVSRFPFTTSYGITYTEQDVRDNISLHFIDCGDIVEYPILEVILESISEEGFDPRSFEHSSDMTPLFKSKEELEVFMRECYSMSYREFKLPEYRKIKDAVEYRY